jgi:hypothetical protein
VGIKNSLLDLADSMGTVPAIKVAEMCLSCLEDMVEIGSEEEKTHAASLINPFKATLALLSE